MSTRTTLLSRPSVKRYGIPPWMTLAGCHYHNYSCQLDTEFCIPVWRMKKNYGRGTVESFLDRVSDA